MIKIILILSISLTLIACVKKEAQAKKKWDDTLVKERVFSLTNAGGYDYENSKFRKAAKIDPDLEKKAMDSLKDK